MTTDSLPPDDDNPFRTPDRDLRSDRPTHDPSVFSEPWMQPVFHAGLPGDSPVIDDSLLTADAEQSVWDEPGLSKALAGEIPEDGLTWFRYFTQRQNSTVPSRSWLFTLLIAAVAGPLAVLGTFFQGAMGNGIVSLIVTGPTIEEVMKIALAVWIVEKRPWMFCSATQILICCCASGLAFAAVENLIYLNIYIRQPSPQIVAWRWSVCVLLHTGCSCVAGIGVVRMWSRIQQRQSRPELIDTAPALMTAIILHGIYNAAALAFQFTGLGPE